MRTLGNDEFPALHIFGLGATFAVTLFRGATGKVATSQHAPSAARGRKFNIDGVAATKLRGQQFYGNFSAFADAR
jgi:hypothetical protein